MRTLWVLVVLGWLALPGVASDTYVVRDAKAQAVIVSQEPRQFAALELQRYVEAITGVRLDIVAPDALRGGALNIAVGGSQFRNLAPFDGLKKDGFVLWRTRSGAHELLIAGGNDDAATLYAVYDLLERLGVTFLITKDVLPEPARELRVADLQLKVETPFPRRGLFISNIYPNRGIWHLSEVKAFLDQMAKMKMNYLQFFWFEHEPWIDFVYRGEHKLLGDATTKETGYHDAGAITMDRNLPRTWPWGASIFADASAWRRPNSSMWKRPSRRSPWHGISCAKSSATRARVTSVFGCASIRPRCKATMREWRAAPRISNCPFIRFWARTCARPIPHCTRSTRSA